MGAYDYVLPVELMERWFKPFVATLGLEQIVASGWAVRTGLWRGHTECFYAPPGRTCDWLMDTRSTLGDPAAWRPSSSPLSFATGADAQLDHFYTPALAAAVTSWARSDLIVFGYPAWDGINGTEYLRGVLQHWQITSLVN